MLHRPILISAITLAVFLVVARAEDRLSYFNEELPKAEEADERGNAQFAEFTRLREAAETGEPQALFDFGAYFYQQQNYTSAREWWGKAAHLGLTLAQIQLAMLYREGDGGPKDPIEAARWFQKAAEQGDAGAQNEMGVLYWRGEGVDRDRVKAGTWFERAANSNYQAAKTNLGWFYLDDSNSLSASVSDEEADLLHRYAASPQKAFQWFCKAATLGDARAQFKVGEAYSNGYGAGMNKLQARLWLEKAAEQNDADAINWLKIDKESAWYTRLENWTRAAFDGELSGTADCSGAADRRHAKRALENAQREREREREREFFRQFASDAESAAMDANAVIASPSAAPGSP